MRLRRVVGSMDFEGRLSGLGKEEDFYVWRLDGVVLNSLDTPSFG
jgi:hypothetical protein